MRNEHTEVPVTKDSENEGAIPSAWRPILKNILDALIRHDYCLADDTQIQIPHDQYPLL
jgi:hypothetical protein